MRAGLRPRLASVLVGLLVAIAALLGVAGSAWAGVGFVVTPMPPPSPVVGQTGLPTVLAIQNASNGPEATGTVTLNQITLVLSCGTQTISSGDCPGASVDPGVLRPSPSGAGEAGTACAGQTFTISLIDPAQGKYRFNPSGPPVGLGPPGGSTATCRIDFTVDVLKMATKDADPVAPGVQTEQVGFAQGTASNGTSGSGVGSSATTVNRGTVPMSTQVSPASITLGDSFHDTATLTPPAGAATPTGEVRFDVYGPSDPTCSGATQFTSVVPVNVAGTTATSGNFLPTTAGTYRVIATYSGDANYAAAGPTACSDPSERELVNRATPSMTTQVAPASIALGASFHDTATLTFPASPVAAPTGNVTFNVYRPGDTGCASAPVLTSVGPVGTRSGPSSATAASADLTPPAAGTYRVVATYGGDANYTPHSTACGDPNEQVIVSQATPSMTTQVSPASIALGSSARDTATFSYPSGASPPTGTVTFRVYGSGDGACAAAPVLSSTVAVASSGGAVTATSGALTPAGPGTYRVTASYSGDGSYAPVSSACSDPPGQLVVNRATVAIATRAVPATVVLGGSFRDTASLGFPAGAPVPTGTVTFNVHGPADPGCTATPVLTSTGPVATSAGAGQAISTALTPPGVGTYRVVASYAGDSNYAPASTLCADPPATVVVTRAVTPPPPPSPSPARACVVPRLNGKTLSGARRALAGARCRLGKVSRQKRRRGSRAGKLVVVSQSLRPGARRRVGTRVNVRLGPRKKARKRRRGKR